MRLRRFAVSLCLVLTSVLLLHGQTTPSRNVVVITLDGLRWQELFGGADRDYFKKSKEGEAGEAVCEGGGGVGGGGVAVGGGDGGGD